MAYPPGMELHGSKWRIKKRVPQDLRRKHPDLYPSQFLTLKTDESDRRAAARKAWVWLGELEEEFQRVRETGSKYKRVLSPGAADEIIHEAIRSSLQADEEIRADGLDDFTYERWIVESIKERLARERQVIARGMMNAEAEDMAHEWLVGFGYDLDRSSPEFKQFAVEFFRRTQMATKAMQARSEGEWVETPSPLPPSKPVQEVPKLSRVIEYFISKQDQKVPMFKKYRPALELFLEFVGDRPVDQIKQMDVEGYFELLCKLPPRWFDEKRKRTVSARELGSMAWPKCISYKTFKDGYLAAFRPFLSASIRTFRDQGFPATLTVEGIKYTGDRKERDHAQRPFKPTELERLFTGPEYRRFAADPSLHHCYWLPLIGLYTGARINEVCQLNPQCDIRQEQGVWVFDITEASETDTRVKKSVKNNPSRRLVPVHSRLLDLGLLAYVEKRKGSGDRLLFPMWKPSANGRAAGVTA
jgi:integrase